MIPIHIASTHRADEGFTQPLIKAASQDTRFLVVPLEAARITVLLGDRTELLDIAAKAILHGQIIAHIAGGERTKGSTDDTVRDAMTKLAHLHYPFHRGAADRIKSLLEEPWRICIAGNPAVDTIKNERLMTASEIRGRWPDVFLSEPHYGELLLAIHPVTNTPGETTKICSLLKSLMGERREYCYFSSPNGDPGSEEIITAIKSMHYSRIVPLPNLGAHAFRSLMAICGNIIGNSSALITEAPHLGCLPVLIGTRQEGRLPDESDGNACKRILDHIAANIDRPDIRIKT